MTTTSAAPAATIDLRHPLPGHHGDITRITLRHPEFGDWIECGDLHETLVYQPDAVGSGTPAAAQVRVRPEAVAKWFARLSGLPMASLAKMDLADARLVMREVSTLVRSVDAGN